VGKPFSPSQPVYNKQFRESAVLYRIQIGYKLVCVTAMGAIPGAWR
jgi:hypothetical protein